MQTQVFTDVERRQLCIDISVDNRNQIHTGKGKDAHVAILAEVILLVFEYGLEPIFLARDIITHREHVFVLLRILSHRDQETECFSLQYRTDSTATLHRWYTEQGDALNKELLKMFDERIVGFSTIMEEIEG